MDATAKTARIKLLQVSNFGLLAVLKALNGTGGSRVEGLPEDARVFTDFSMSLNMDQDIVRVVVESSTFEPVDIFADLPHLIVQIVQCDAPTRRAYRTALMPGEPN